MSGSEIPMGMQAAILIFRDPAVSAFHPSSRPSPAGDPLLCQPPPPPPPLTCSDPMLWPLPPLPHCPTPAVTPSCVHLPPFSTAPHLL